MDEGSLSTLYERDLCVLGWENNLKRQGEDPNLGQLLGKRYSNPQKEWGWQKHLRSDPP